MQPLPPLAELAARLQDTVVLDGDAVETVEDDFDDGSSETDEKTHDSDLPIGPTTLDGIHRWFESQLTRMREEFGFAEMTTCLQEFVRNKANPPPSEILAASPCYIPHHVYSRSSSSLLTPAPPLPSPTRSWSPAYGQCQSAEAGGKQGRDDS